MKGGGAHDLKPREQHVDGLIHKLHIQHELAHERVIAPADLVEVHNGVHGREEAAVQPAAALQDELGHAVRHVRLAVGALDVLQDPAAVALAHELEAQDAVLGQVHVGGEDARVGAVHLLAREVLLERALVRLVVLQRHVAISRERAGKHRDEAKGRLERLVEDVAHLVLEVLRRDQRVDELLAGAQHDLDLAAGAAAHRLEIEGLPELVDRVLAGLGAGVDEHADVRFKDRAEGLEEPAVAVDLLLILFFQAEQHLHGRGALGLELHQLALQVQAHLRRVLVNVRRDLLLVDRLLADAVLVHAEARQHRARARVDLGAPVAHHAHDDLLPRLLAPRLAGRAVRHDLDVLEHADQGAREQEVVLVVHGHHDEQLRVAGLREQALAQREALGEEVGRVARRGRVAHVRELVALRRRRVRDLVQQPRRHRAVEHQVAVEQLHLLDRLPPPDRGLRRRRRHRHAGRCRAGRHVIAAGARRHLVRVWPVGIIRPQDRRLVVVGVVWELLVAVDAGMLRLVRLIEVRIVVLLGRYHVFAVAGGRVVVGAGVGHVLGVVGGLRRGRAVVGRAVVVLVRVAEVLNRVGRLRRQRVAGVRPVGHVFELVAVRRKALGRGLARVHMR